MKFTERSGNQSSTIEIPDSWLIAFLVIVTLLFTVPMFLINNRNDDLKSKGCVFLFGDVHWICPNDKGRYIIGDYELVNITK